MGAAWVYILRCADGTLYTGATVDLQARMRAHGRGRASKYTRGRLPVQLVYSEPLDSWPAALAREQALKALPRRRKLALIDRSAIVTSS